jgi:thiol:disulfide interchange protein/DsbC/DsbD-like thiol-disulfide interchange protein
VAETLNPAAGHAATLAIVMRPQPGWHGYWHTPGDAGFPTKLSWKLPADVTVGEPAYPVPGRLLIGGMMNFVYDHEYAVLVPLKLPANLATGSRLPIALKLDYLVCTSQACVPESANISTLLTVGDGKPDPAASEKFSAWRMALPQPLGSSAAFNVEKGLLRVAVPFPHDAKIDDPHLYIDAQNVVDFAAQQRFSRKNDLLIIETKAAGEVSSPFNAVLQIGHNRGIAFASKPGAVPANGDPLIAGAGDGSAATATRAGNVIEITLVAFLGAMLGGLILNVMPCVFPILSLKALSLAKSSDNRAARHEAIAYTGGLIVVCVALGALMLGLRAAGDQVGWAFQLQNPSVIFILILLVGAIAFNLAGLFELSAMTAGSGLAQKPGTSGAFWTGALAAFVATPCTGPFMAAALGAALVLPVAAALLVFMGLGLGIALPFLAIGFVPKLRRALPKPGAWMNTFRHILAVPMFLTAVGLIWVLGSQAGTTGMTLALLALLVSTLGLWATGLRQNASKMRAWVPGAAALVAALALIMALPAHSTATADPGSADSGRTAVQPFNAAKLAALRAEGRPVFLYMTASWCLTCKVNERVAIDRAETQAAFAKAGVVTMVGDWTNGDAAITQFLQTNGRSGVPLYLWYAPHQDAKTLPQVLTVERLSNLAKSRS